MVENRCSRISHYYSINNSSVLYGQNILLTQSSLGFLDTYDFLRLTPLHGFFYTGYERAGVVNGSIEILIIRCLNNHLISLYL